MSAMAQGLLLPCSSAPSFPRSAHSLTFRCSMRLAGMQSPQPVPLWRSPSALRAAGAPCSYCSRSSQSAARQTRSAAQAVLPRGARARHHRGRTPGKLVSKKTKVDIIVTPLVTIFSGCGLAYFIRAVHRHGGFQRGQPYHVGNHPAAVPHGYSRFRHRRRCIDAADFQRGHLRGARFNGPLRAARPLQAAVRR